MPLCLLYKELLAVVAVPLDGWAGPMADLRILIVDDDAVVPEGLKFLLQTQLGSMDIGKVRSGEEAIDLLHQGHWDIVLLAVFCRDAAVLMSCAKLKIPSCLARSLSSECIPKNGTPCAQYGQVPLTT